MGEVSEAGFVTADLAVEEADLAASRGLDIFATGLEGLEMAKEIETVDRVVVRPGQLYVVRSRSGSRRGQNGVGDEESSMNEPDCRTGNQHLISRAPNLTNTKESRTIDVRSG